MQLERGWGKVAQLGVPPLSVVKDFDVLPDFANCFVPCSVVPMVNEFSFESAEETLHRSVIPAVALAAHRREDAELLKQLAITFLSTTGSHGRSDEPIPLVVASPLLL
jgi:hypothetical protein